MRRHAPRGQPRAGDELWDVGSNRSELEPGAAAERRGEHRLVLDGRERARRVDEVAARPQELQSAGEDGQLQREHRGRRTRLPRVPNVGVLAQRAVAGARHVAQHAVKTTRLTWLRVRVRVRANLSPSPTHNPNANTFEALRLTGHALRRVAREQCSRGEAAGEPVAQSAAAHQVDVVRHHAS